MKKYLFVYLMILSTLFSLVSESKSFQDSHEFTVKTETDYKYLLYKPKHHTTKKHPLVVFLHGGGESGENIEVVKKNGLPKMIAEGKEFPFYVLSPQNPYEKGFWDDRAVYKIIKHILYTHSIDQSRIYLTGMSRGGFGAWNLAMNHPDLFAAAAIVCPAQSPYNYAKRVKHLPIWLFHGIDDKVIPVSGTIKIYEELKRLGGNVKISLYPEVRHDSWVNAYEKEDLVSWFLQFEK